MLSTSSNKLLSQSTQTAVFLMSTAWEAGSPHRYSRTQAPTERLVLNPLKSYEWRSNGKVNRPRRKINLENCLNSCRPVSLSLRDHTDGRGWDECLLVLRGQVHRLYSGLRGLISFVSAPPTSAGCLFKRYWPTVSKKEGMWIIDQKLSREICSNPDVDFPHADVSCLLFFFFFSKNNSLL